MAGVRLGYGKLIGWRCRWGCSGMLRCAGGAKDIPMPEAVTKDVEALWASSIVGPDGKAIYTGM